MTIPYVLRLSLAHEQPYILDSTIDERDHDRRMAPESSDEAVACFTRNKTQIAG